MEKIWTIEQSELPKEIQTDLEQYYRNTDHRGIPNDSYSRYPYLSDFEEFESATYDWLKTKGVCKDDMYVIIHWDW